MHETLEKSYDELRYCSKADHKLKQISSKKLSHRGKDSKPPTGTRCDAEPLDAGKSDFSKDVLA